MAEFERNAGLYGQKVKTYGSDAICVEHATLKDAMSRLFWQRLSFRFRGQPDQDQSQGIDQRDGRASRA